MDSHDTLIHINFKRSNNTQSVGVFNQHITSSFYPSIQSINDLQMKFNVLTLYLNLNVGKLTRIDLIKLYSSLSAIMI